MDRRRLAGTVRKQAKPAQAETRMPAKAPAVHMLSGWRVAIARV
jgi:hypothetical protein